MRIDKQKRMGKNKRNLYRKIRDESIVEYEMNGRQKCFFLKIFK